MEKITKENLNQFLTKYQNLHDSKIESTFYDINNSQIEIIFNIIWTYNPKTKKSDIVQTHKGKIKMIFSDIEECNNKEIFSYDFIYEAYIKYIKLKEKEYICFASDKTDPFIYIVCKEIEYVNL